jgi:hypothetical protein
MRSAWRGCAVRLGEGFVGSLDVMTSVTPTQNARRVLTSPHSRVGANSKERGGGRFYWYGAFLRLPILHLPLAGR